MKIFLISFSIILSNQEEKIMSSRFQEQINEFIKTHVYRYGIEIIICLEFLGLGLDQMLIMRTLAVTRAYVATIFS